MMTFLYSFSMVCRREPSCFSFLGLPSKNSQVIFSGFKEQKFILSQFWGADVQNQGAGIIGTSGSSERESAPCFLSL